MKRFKQLLFTLMLIGSAGIAYAIFTLKNIPEIFDWSLDEEVDDEQ